MSNFNVLVGGKKRETVLDQRLKQIEEAKNDLDESAVSATASLDFVNIGLIEGRAFELEVQATCDSSDFFLGQPVSRRFNTSLQYIRSRGAGRHLVPCESMYLATRRHQEGICGPLRELIENMYRDNHTEWLDTLVEQWADGTTHFREGISGIKDFSPTNRNNSYDITGVNVRLERSFSVPPGIITLGTFIGLKYIGHAHPPLVEYLYGKPMKELSRTIIDNGGIYLPEQGAPRKNLPSSHCFLLMRGGTHPYQFRATINEQAASRGCRIVDPFKKREP